MELKALNGKLIPVELVSGAEGKQVGMAGNTDAGLKDGLEEWFSWEQSQRLLDWMRKNRERKRVVARIGERGQLFVSIEDMWGGDDVWHIFVKEEVKDEQGR